MSQGADYVRNDVAAWAADCERQGLRLFVEDADGWLHQFRVKGAPAPPRTQFLAMNIVNQLFDLAEVSVEKRQAINDEADAFVYRLLTQQYDGPEVPAATRRRQAIRSVRTTVPRSDQSG